MTDFHTNSQVVLITGCSTGIGLCVAKGLHQRGYRVFASARKLEDVKMLQTLGLEALQLDLDDSSSINSAVDELLEKTNGEIYALFNNGGYGQMGAVEDLSRDNLRAQFETNVFGWIELSNRVIPIMRAQKSGRIIQNSSVLGFAAMPYRGAYNASKFAIEGFTDTLRLELRGSGVYVSLVEPGPIESKFRSNGLRIFLETIDYKNCAHKDYYDAIISRLGSEKSSARFTLGPEHVLKRVLHALESNKPNIRYPVTVPTYLFRWLKRFLPDSQLDKILGKFG